MSTHAPESQDRSKSQKDGHVDVVRGEPLPLVGGRQVDVAGVKLVGPVEELSDESLLPPPPAAYSVEISVSKAPPPAPPPVAPQPSAPLYASELESEKVVVAAPLSFAGSAVRIWKLTRLSPDTWMRVLLGVAAVVLIVCAWVFVLAWYLFWGIWLVPYRLIRRGSRKRKREGLQHRELIAAIQDQKKDVD